ncbi:N-acetylneuraminate synthase family protein [Poseidonibacter lekithochrous]|uniref:N-acetylneuraminate synthase family protein n=1 Tax=Poseidonibacter lekithochrous TaxID=1904463 RepID=UPI0008FCBD36|nr:N-acetylneuraminate synthase family protein [Poseidonibacter lekithochrous]QKJ24486.1 N-acetylneuraminate synthase family protein, putative legionaminic acid synthase LegI [Poseidonibacter lekithochrous]
MNNNTFNIGSSEISANSKTYFIADIAANHDGDLQKAKDLIYLAKEAGADAAKFQHFKASSIVSDVGFKNLGSKSSHQKNWNKSIYEVYKDAEVPLRWTEELYNTCKKAEIDFFTSPYDINDIDYINNFVPAYKVGSGDITFHEIVEKMASFYKPMIVATGASNIEEVICLINKLEKINKQIVLMQCNTNYTASNENFKYIQLNVLKSYAQLFPNAILGLSDHTLGHTTVLGAVALGAKVVEKHFTDNNSLEGPDHKFSMNPLTWREMIDRTRELEYALGTCIKKIEDNELETSVLQRRCLRATRDLNKNDVITSDMFEPLRPAPKGTVLPFEKDNILGKKLSNDIKLGNSVNWSDIIL